MQTFSARIFFSIPVLLVIALAGCPARTATSGNGSGASTAKVDANELVEAMRAAYRDAKTYADNGRLTWQIKSGDAWRDATADFSTAFERPNRCELKVRGLHLTSDGKLLRATIANSEIGNFNDQMLQRKVPENLALTDMLADAEITSALTDPAVDSIPWPLRMLTDDASLERLLAGKLQLLADESLAGEQLHRVEITQSDRRTVLWIDPKSHLLRRVELPDPVAALGVRSAVADFADAKINVEHEPQRFLRMPPPGATLVNYFVPPPPAIELPTPLLGKAVGDFTFEKADGSTLKRDALAGQVVVLAWYDERPASQHTLAQLQAAFEKYKANEKVRFFAVSPPVPLTSEELQKSLTALKVSLPLLRDEQAVGRDLFAIPGAPTVVVLDGQHRVQEFIQGYKPLIDQMLPQIIDELLAGGNLASEYRQMLAQDAADYRRKLAAAKVGAPATVIEMTPTAIAPQRDPAKLKLTKLWTCSEIKSPGNILVVDNEGTSPTLLVLDHTEDWKTVAELDAQGKLVARHELALPQTGAVSVLKSAIDRDGRRWYVGGSRLAHQAFVLNDNWEVAAAYPASDARHDGVGDFALVDFKSDGQLQLCVGFWGVLGVHGVSLTGERQWTNRSAAPVVSLSISPPDAADRRQILATTDRGEIVTINGFGNSAAAKRVEHLAVTSLVASNLGTSAIAVYMGVAAQADGSQIATALSEKLEPLWDVPLPAGTHRNQIQPITSGKLLAGEVGQWLFAGADGSIGIVSEDATFFDSLAIGQELAGLAVAQFGDRRVILTATSDGVTAWSVEEP